MILAERNALMWDVAVVVPPRSDTPVIQLNTHGPQLYLADAVSLRDALTEMIDLIEENH